MPDRVQAGSRAKAGPGAQGLLPAKIPPLVDDGFDKKARIEELMAKGLPFNLAGQIAGREQMRHRESQKTPEERAAMRDRILESGYKPTLKKYNGGRLPEMNYQQQMPMGMTLPPQMPRPPLNNPMPPQMPRPPLNNPMPQMQPPMQPMANQMAQHGRYGDSMMVHMNPAEVQGIAALSPTGRLTRNPVTGQPEAFLPFLAPLLGSMFGKAVLAKSIPFLAGKTALASAIGSGLATTAATGDVKKGLISGITGFGLGKALGAASDALNPQIAATQTALEGAESIAAQAGVDLASANAALVDPLSQAVIDPITGEAVTQAFSPLPVTDPITGATMSPSLVAPQVAAFDPEFISGPLADYTTSTAAKYAADESVGRLAGTLVDPVTGMPRPESLAGLRDAQSIGQDLSAPFKEPKAFAKELMKTENLAAIGIGEGQIASMKSQEENEARNRAYEAEEEAKRQRALENIEESYAQLERDYPDYKITRGAANGGIVSLDPQRYVDTVNNVYKLAGGGPVLNYWEGGPSEYMRGVMNSISSDPSIGPTGRPGAASRQSGLRGKAISPEELIGYKPGFDPEINYFPKIVLEDPPISTETVVDSDPGDWNEDYIPSTGRPDFMGGGFYGGNVGGMEGMEDFAFNETMTGMPQGGIKSIAAIKAQEDIGPPANLFTQDDGSVRPGSDNQLLQDYISMADTSQDYTAPPVSSYIPSEDLVMSDVLKDQLAESYQEDGSVTSGSNQGVNYPVNFNPLEGLNIGAAGFDQGGITALTEENINPRVPVEESFVDAGAMTDTLEANGQSLIDQTVMAIAGQLPEGESEMVINEFIEQFGPEAFSQLRDRVLSEIVPGAQTEGEIVGAGGGMDDMVQGMIGDQQRVAVSPGEYIVPADVVSGIGDGSTDAGVGELDQMLNRVREERTGTTRQPPRLASAGGVLPA